MTAHNLNHYTDLEIDSCGCNRSGIDDVEHSLLRFHSILIWLLNNFFHFNPFYLYFLCLMHDI